MKREVGGDVVVYWWVVKWKEFVLDVDYFDGCVRGCRNEILG